MWFWNRVGLCEAGGWGSQGKGVVLDRIVKGQLVTRLPTPQTKTQGAT
jgi:hypothetical protein